MTKQDFEDLQLKFSLILNKNMYREARMWFLSIKIKRHIGWRRTYPAMPAHILTIFFNKRTKEQKDFSDIVKLINRPLRGRGVLSRFNPIPEDASFLASSDMGL